MSSYARERAQERIGELACHGLDLVSFWREATAIIERVVPHYMAPCWYTLDPTSLLITSHFNEYMPVLPRDALALEYYEDDVNQLADVARSATGVSTLHNATQGDPTSSPRWQANIQLGGDQELILALRGASGQAWGGLGLYREPAAPTFDGDEISFLRAVAPVLGEGARRALLLGEATDPEGPHSPGLLVLSADWEIESATVGVEQWLSDLPGADRDGGRLPSAVLSVAGRALRSAEGRDAPGEVALARVLTRSGTWVVLHGAALLSDGTRRVAVIVEPAHPARIAPLLMVAYGLSDREQDVTRLVLQANRPRRSPTGSPCRRTPSSSTSKASSTRRGYAAAATSSARSSSRGTSRVCATTRRTCRRKDHCAAAHSQPAHRPRNPRPRILPAPRRPRDARTTASSPAFRRGLDSRSSSELEAQR